MLSAKWVCVLFVLCFCCAYCPKFKCFSRICFPTSYHLVPYHFFPSSFVICMCLVVLRAVCRNASHHLVFLPLCCLQVISCCVLCSHMFLYCVCPLLHRNLCVYVLFSPITDTVKIVSHVAVRHFVFVPSVVPTCCFLANFSVLLFYACWVIEKCLCAWLVCLFSLWEGGLECRYSVSVLLLFALLGTFVKYVYPVPVFFVFSYLICWLSWTCTKRVFLCLFSLSLLPLFSLCVCALYFSQSVLCVCVKYLSPCLPLCSYILFTYPPDNSPLQFAFPCTFSLTITT